jgi:hypothetical protein
MTGGVDPALAVTGVEKGRTMRVVLEEHLTGPRQPVNEVNVLSEILTDNSNRLGCCKYPNDFDFAYAAWWCQRTDTTNPPQD